MVHVPVVQPMPIVSAWQFDRVLACVPALHQQQLDAGEVYETVRALVSRPDGWPMPLLFRNEEPVRYPPCAELLFIQKNGSYVCVTPHAILAETAPFPYEFAGDEPT